MLTENSAAPLVLVVEDDVNHAELILRAFEDDQSEFRLEMCGSISDAKAATKRCPPRFVLTDYRLPDGEGSELVVSSLGAWPVIIMTSQGNEQIAVEAMKIGAQDYIVKSPSSIENLPRTVSFGLQSWSLVQARRQSDEAVLRAKRDWERTFDAVPDMIAVIDAKHTITRVNRAMAERCGMGVGDIIGLKCHQVVHGVNAAPECCPGECVLQNGQIHSIGIEEKRLNGFFDVTVSPLTDDAGRVTSYVHVMRDISRQKKTEELVRQRIKLREIAITSNVDELMQATLDACELLTESSIGFFHLVDEDQENLTLKAWSTNTMATMCNAEGHDSHYPISKAGVWVECFHTREPVIHNDYATLPHRKGMPAGHAPVVRELTIPVIIHDKVVSIIGVGNKGTPYTNDDVYIVKQFVVFASEVIGRKKAVIELRDSEEKHRKLANEQRAILNATSVGICFLKNRTVQWTNPAFDAIFGYAVGGCVGLDTEVFYPARETYDKIGSEAYEIIASGTVYAQDVMMKRTDGALIWCNLVGQAVTPGSSEDGSIWVMMDITDRINAEQERLHLEQQFQQTQKLESLGVLAGGIAHDFNNILTVILGHCYMVNEGFDSGFSAQVHVKHIEKAGNRAAELCRQMLAYAGNSPQQIVSVNLWLLVDEIVKMLQSAIKKNVDIHLDLKRDVPEIVADNAQIQQVIMNLIINAAEAIGGNNGTIKVSLNTVALPDNHGITDFFGAPILPGRYARLEVADTGCGMNDEVVSRIFEPFYTTKFTGRGLGMSAILGIIKSHNGALQLNSTLGEGSVFKIYFPLPEKCESALVESLPDHVLTEMVHGTVLLVDDEEGLRAIGTALLTAMGFNVMTASNGREALELYRTHGTGIDVVLLDLIMPEMGGIETYYELRTLNRVLPVVICSGYGVEELQDTIDGDPNVGTIQKPYNPNQLRKILLSHLEVNR